MCLGSLVPTFPACVCLCLHPVHAPVRPAREVCSPPQRGLPFSPPQSFSSKILSISTAGSSLSNPTVESCPFPHSVPTGSRLTANVPGRGFPSLKTVAWNKTSILPGNPEDTRMQVKQRFPVLWLSGNRNLSTPSFQFFPSADGYGELPAGTNGSRPTFENSVPWGGCSSPCGVRSFDAGFEGAPPEGRPKCPASSSEQGQPRLRSWGPPRGPGLSAGGPGGLRAVVAARGGGLPRSLRGRGGRERRGAGRPRPRPDARHAGNRTSSSGASRKPQAAGPGARSRQDGGGQGGRRGRPVRQAGAEEVQQGPGEGRWPGRTTRPSRRPEADRGACRVPRGAWAELRGPPLPRQTGVGLGFP